MPRGLPPHGGLSSWIMSNQKHIVLAGGGTAGHVNPLLAVAHVIRELEPEADIAVVGTAVGLERDLVPQAGFELETIEKVPFPRRPNKAARPRTAWAFRLRFTNRTHVRAWPTSWARVGRP